ncbi:MAG: sugar transferase [Anaerolineales bacterium]|nr:sugar transferase [Anaerolineales bacterium]
MSRRGRLLLLASLLGTDTFAVCLALVSAIWLTRTWSGAGVQPNGPGALPGDYAQAVALGLLPWLFCFYALRLYDLETVLEDSQEYATVATGCTYGILLLIVAATLAGNSGLALRWLFAGWVGSLLAVGAGRFLMRRVVRAMRRRGHLMASALIVGADEQGRAIARQLRSEVDSGLRVLGFVDDFLPRGTVVEAPLTVLGHPGVLPALVQEQRVSEIVVVPGAMAWESFHSILERITLGGGPRIRLSPGYYDLLATTPRVAHRNFVPLFVVDSARLSGFDAVLKALVDYGLGGMVFVLTLPLLAVIVLSRLGRRPALVTREYVGTGGRLFRAQTLAVQPDEALARAGLDRLPLLWQVLAGRLSLVGPRPIPAGERSRYGRWLPSLASVKPGVTGPWAVVPVAALEEEMRAVLYYIRNWTVWLDLQILAQAVLVTLRGRWGKLDA